MYLPLAAPLELCVLGYFLLMGALSDGSDREEE